MQGYLRNNEFSYCTCFSLQGYHTLVNRQTPTPTRQLDHQTPNRQTDRQTPTRQTDRQTPTRQLERQTPTRQLDRQTPTRHLERQVAQRSRGGTPASGGVGWDVRASPFPALDLSALSSCPRSSPRPQLPQVGGAVGVSHPEVG